MYVSLQIPQDGFRGQRLTVLSGTVALNYPCTLLSAMYDLHKRWRAWRTMRLEMMVLVAAMVGMI